MTQKSNQPLSEFPLIRPDEFLEALVSLHTIFEQSERSNWERVILVEEHGLPCLSIHRRVAFDHHNVLSTYQTSDLDTEANDGDNESVQKSSQVRPELELIYEIFLSPTFRVPVLYLRVQHDVGRPEQLAFDPVKHLTPSSLQPQVQGVGVLGAITMTDHPASGMPCYFVHPCNTAEAMRAVVTTKPVSPFDYLVKWMGLVGGSIGLSIPHQMFLPDSTSLIS